METMQLLKLIRHSPLYNYIIPGLTSYIVKEFGEDQGMLRMFEMERTQLADIAPHSHRFDFECTVLHGQVYNTTWTQSEERDSYAEPFIATRLTYGGRPGEYLHEPMKHVTWWAPNTVLYAAGKNPQYSMTNEEVHSIRFSRGAIVLFKEGPTKVRDTTMLDPFTRGIIAEISPVKDWMFRKGFL